MIYVGKINRKHAIKKIFLSLASFLLIVHFCSCSPEENIDKPNNTYVQPELTNDGLDVASLSSVGMNESKFIQLLDRLDFVGEHRIHSILVMRDKKLVFEKYYQGRKFNLGQYTGGTGYNINDIHTLCSATKSIVSALLGIAIDKGYIESIDQKVFDFFPEYTDLLALSPEKNKLAIKHLLTMSSGLVWDDESLPYTDHRNDMHLMFEASDPIRFILAKPLFAEPGTVFDYDNCNTNVIGQIISKATNKRLDEFANEFLFSKLGITQLQWQMLRNNVVFCSGDLHLRPRDMAKFGLLFLNKGEWEGEQIISQMWCDISTAAYLNPNDYNNEFPWANGYGYQWWRKTYHYNNQSYNSYFASGWGGQNIIIVPDLNMVIIITAGNWYESEKISPFTIVSDYIIPAVK